MKILSFRVKKPRSKKGQTPQRPIKFKRAGKKPFGKKIKLPGLPVKNIFKNIKPRQRSILLAITGIALCAVLLALTGVGSAVTASANKRECPIYNVHKSTNVVSLTFDAAWGNEDTEQLISILGKYNIKATFFVVGEWVDKYPESVQALHDAGHEIMNHSADHDHYTELNPDQIITDLNVCNDKIEAITGVRPTLFRCPYGDYNDRVVSTVRSIDMQVIQWDVDSLDWKDKSPEEITSRVLDRVQPGSIVLFHNAALNTPAALPDIIEGLLQKGYTFLPVSQLVLTEDYIIDHAGKQVPANMQ